MTIDRLGMTNPVQDTQKAASGLARASGAKTDTVSLSPEALRSAEFFRTAELVHAAPDVRADRIAEVRAKLQNPGWIDSLVLDKTADRLLDQLLG